MHPLLVLGLSFYSRERRVCGIGKLILITTKCIDFFLICDYFDMMFKFYTLGTYVDRNLQVCQNTLIPSLELTGHSLVCLWVTQVFVSET